MASTPTTRPFGPTSGAAMTASRPVPQARISTRSLGLMVMRLMKRLVYWGCHELSYSCARVRYDCCASANCEV